jgi:hypothetical protein
MLLLMLGDGDWAMVRLPKRSSIPLTAGRGAEEEEEEEG